jgi:hypothetical protein
VARFSAQNDALLLEAEHRIDPKSGFHFWVRCSKHVFQVHGIGQDGQVLILRQLRRSEVNSIGKLT